MLQRGYYESVIGVGRLNSQLWEIYMNRPLDLEMLWQTPAVRRTDDYLKWELLPSQKVTLNGTEFTTNRWALRDREYALAKPPRTFRIAVAGASSTMGWAVGDDETFENLLEDRLNRDQDARASYERFELLNFAMLGLIPPQYWGTLDRTLAFQPDVYLLTTQDNDVVRTTDRLAYYGLHGTPFPDDSMYALARRVTEGASTEAEAERRMAPYGELIIAHYYRLIADRCRERGVRPVWFFLPGLEGLTDMPQKTILFRSARAAGFTILDLSDVYAGHDLATLRVRKADYHPNRVAHRLIAKRLRTEILRHPEVLSPLATQPD